MTRDALATLIKVRQLTCDEAQRKLVAALTDEGQTEQIVHGYERAIAHEMELASDPSSSDAVVEAFGAWLVGARRQLEAARRVLVQRQAEAVRLRAELTACRTALESVEALHRQRREAATRARERSLERELEDRPSLDGTSEREMTNGR